MTKKLFINSVVFILVVLLTPVKLTAQNSSPYWSLAGNSNATSSSKLGTTNLVPLKFFTNNSQRMILDSLGRVGIGITKPVNIFTVKSGGGTPAASWLNGLNTPVFVGFGEVVSSEFLLAGASNTANNRAVFQGRRSRGTLAAPTAVANNDYITSLLASAYDGSTFQNPALVSFFVDGTPSAGNVPTRISFVTGSNAGNRTERLKVGSTGNFDFNNGQVYLNQASGFMGIGITTPENKLHVFKGNAGLVTAFSAAPLVVENSANCYINMLSPEASASGILFGKPSNNASGGIVYNDVSFNSNGFDFRTNGNITQMVLNNAGNLGIGILSPRHRLQVVAAHDGDGISVVGSASGPKDAAIILEDDAGHSGQLGLASANDAFMLGLIPGDMVLTNASGKLHFGTGVGTRPAMTVSGSSIGIGTINPGNYKLKISHSDNNAQGGFGLDIENAATLDNWELYSDGHKDLFGFTNLYLFWNGHMKGIFDGETGGYQSVSDERLKTNIKPMATMLDKINQLKPSTYQFKNKNTTNGQEHNGFIAQDVMKIFPSLVTHNVNPERKLDVYTMDYSGFGILAIKGIQELQPMIEEQKKINEEQKEEIDSIKNAEEFKFAILEDRIKKLEAALETLTANKNEKTSTIITNASLEQNVPNPFTHNTTIGYTLPQNFTSAEIKVSDKNGKILKTINISGTGKGTLNVDASILSSGAYNYSLFVNGKLISTKQMERLK